MPELTRLQIRKNDTEHTWNDVGNKAGDESIPVTVLSMPSIVVTASDIEIGAVEIKDGTSDTRAGVDSSNRLKTLATENETSPIDASKVNPSLSYDITGSTCVISQVIGAVTYQKTYNWSTNPITESVWVQI